MFKRFKKLRAPRTKKNWEKNLIQREFHDAVLKKWRRCPSRFWKKQVKTITFQREKRHSCSHGPCGPFLMCLVLFARNGAP